MNNEVESTFFVLRQIIRACVIHNAIIMAVSQVMKQFIRGLKSTRIITDWALNTKKNKFNVINKSRQKQVLNPP
jgi:hypothetical protein